MQPARTAPATACKAFFLVGCLASLALAADPDAAAALAAAGVGGGLAVHVGSTDGKLEIALTNKGKFLVHGIALDDASRDQARAAIHAAGLYGLASVERYSDLSMLPYAENLVNLLVADMDALGAKAPPDSQILRVLVPGTGVAYLKRGGQWTKALAKPMPAGMDEWTHWEHGPDGNALSRDQGINPPTGLQWLADNTRFVGMYNASVTGLRAAGGRVVYTEKPDRQVHTEAKHNFHGRDAFNGIALWARKDYNFVSWHDRSCLVMDKDRIYTFDDMTHGKHLVALDAATGQVVKEYDQGLTYDNTDDMFFVRLAGGKLIQAYHGQVMALDPASGAVAWKASVDGNAYFPAVSLDRKAVYVAVAGSPSGFSQRWPNATGLKSIVALDLDQGARKWENAEFAGRSLGQIIAYQDKVMLWASNSGQEGSAGALDAATGKLLWSASTKDQDPYHGVVWKDLIVGYGYGGLTAWETGTGKQAWHWDSPYYNQRCSRLTADVNYLNFGITMYMGQDLSYTPINTTRSQCATGVHFAYGMQYFTPITCGCLVNPMRGWQAYNSAGWMKPLDDARRLEGGGGAAGALTQALAATGPLADDWKSTDAFDSLRTGPATVGDITVTPIPNEHRVEGRRGGALAWSVVTGGRVTGTPAVSGGKVLFGSHDGWAYCVNGADGKLLWRFLAAPNERKVVAYSQLESAWPVFGVQVSGDKAIFAAGRHSELDAGIYVYSVDVATGALACKKRIYTQFEKLDFKNVSGNHRFFFQNTGMLNGPDGFPLDCSDGSDVVLRAIKAWDNANGYSFQVPPVTFGPTYGTIPTSLRGVRARPGREYGPLGAQVLGFRAEGLVVAVTGAGPHSLRLLDVAGHELYRARSARPGVHVIPRRDLRPGSYLLRIEGGAGAPSRTDLFLPVR